MPGVTVNRFFGSGMDAVVMVARAIKAGEIDLAIAGGVESMSRAPSPITPRPSAALCRQRWQQSSD